MIPITYFSEKNEYMTPFCNLVPVETFIVILPNFGRLEASALCYVEFMCMCVCVLMRTVRVIHLSFVKCARSDRIGECVSIVPFFFIVFHEFIRFHIFSNVYVTCKYGKLIFANEKCFSFM